LLGAWVSLRAWVTGQGDVVSVLGARPAADVGVEVGLERRVLEGKIGERVAGAAVIDAGGDAA
jgi:hypothetical protein